VTKVATFNLPWRLALLPDGRMLLTEKVGPIWVVSQTGEKTPVKGVPAVVSQGQGGMFAAYLSPHYAADHMVYITYAEPADGKSLFLTSGDRQRMTPAQDPNSPLGKILRLTLDGKPAPGNPMAGKTGAQTLPIIDPPKDTETAKTQPVVRTYAFPGPNLTPS